MVQASVAILENGLQDKETWCKIITWAMADMGSVKKWATRWRGVANL